MSVECGVPALTGTQPVENLLRAISFRERRLSGWAAWYRQWACIGMIVLSLLAVLDIAPLVGVVVFRQQYLAIFFGLLLSVTFVAVPARRGSAPGNPGPVDIVFALLSLIVSGYVAFNFSDLLTSLSTIRPERIVLGAIALFLTFEAARRLTGLPLVVTVGLFVLYAHFSYLAPGILNRRGSSWERIFTFLYLDPNSLFGFTLDTIFSVVAPFMLFGGLLYMAGGDRILNDLALVAFGRMRGGVAKMTAVSGALFGMMSGSAAANVVVSGVFTIPLMKRQGYSKEFAAAVEATSSSGGVIAPPVMGAAAFIMAEFLNIPYSEVALAAVIPATLFYLTGYFQIDFEAARLGLRGLRPEELPSTHGLWKDVIVFIGPVAVLCYFLFVMNLPPQRAALYASVVVMVLAAFRPQTRIGPRRFLAALEDAGATTVQMGVVSALAGFILGVLTLNGLGSVIAQVIVAIAGANGFVLLLVSALACVVLAMGLPAVAIYVLLAVLIVPALVQFGFDPLASHMFILYLGVMSYITPPMAYAALVAAPIAGANHIRVALVAMRLSVVAYLVPFLFVFYPALLLRGSVFDIAYAFGAAVAGSWVLAAALAGYLHRPLDLRERLWLGVIASVLLIPEYVTTMVGLVLLALFVAYDRIWRRTGHMTTAAGLPPAS